MDTFIRLTNQTQGRDRLFRATQYTCMLLRYLLEPRPGQEKVVEKLQSLEASVSTGRKWFRLGNMAHALQAMQQSLRATEMVPRVCLTLANLNRVVYFICDTVLWARSVGLVAAVDKERWRHRAARHYYYSLLLSLARDVYELTLHMEQLARRRAQRAPSAQAPEEPSVADEEVIWLQSLLLLLLRSLKQQPSLLLDILKNACDLLNPLHQLGIYESNLGLVGLGGLLSSLAGLILVLYPHLKLKIR